MATATKAPETPAPSIMVGEVCDACGAQAYMKAVLPDGGELFFCAHHGRKHAKRLVDIGAEIFDETDRLNN